MNVKLISITPDAEKQIAFCARVSSENQDNPEIAKLIKYCIKHQHWSILEQAFVTVEINTSRMISPQLLRHRSFTFQEFSQRYQAVTDEGIELYAARRQDVKNKQNSIDDLSDAVKKEWEQRQLDNWKQSFTHYTWALNCGIAKECARAVLPLQTTTKLYMSGSLRSFIHYIAVRAENSTQAEHQSIAIKIRSILKKELPIVAEALEW